MTLLSFYKVNEEIAKIEKGADKEIDFEQPEIEAPPEPEDDDEDADPEDENGQVDWWLFDDREYLALGALKPGEDPYDANKFNLAASDKIKSDRSVPDTRHAQCRTVKKLFKLL